MQILEHGQEHERTLLFLPCTAEPVWAFADTIALLLGNGTFSGGDLTAISRSTLGTSPPWSRPWMK